MNRLAAFGFFALTLNLLFASGCGKPRRAVVTLNGTVTYKGAPVVAGAIYLHSEDNRVAMGPIHDDGTFIATEVPVGEVRISFQFKGGSNSKDMYGSVDKAKGVTSLPAKYSDPNTSDLKYTITEGMQKLDLKLD